MIGALTYLLVESWKNRTMMRIRRLKQPKYMVGAIAGGVYLYFYFYRFLLNPHRFGHKSGLAFTPETVQWLEPLGATILFVIFLLAWIFPQERAALIFSEAEVAFLFPAPVSRRTLVHYKLLKSQLRILFSVFFLMIFTGRFLIGTNPWSRGIGWWVILSTLNLHFIGSSFAVTLLTDHGLTKWRRRITVYVITAAIAVGIFFWAKKTIPPPDPANIKGLPDIGYYFEQASSSGPAVYLLYPFRLLVRPYLQTTLVTFLEALGPALALMALHYLWVIKSNVAFEEASIDASKKMAERIANMRAHRGQLSRPKKKKRPPFQLRPHGPQVVGFLWKNLIGAGQAFTLRFWLMILYVVVIGSVIAKSSPAASNFTSILGIIALLFAAILFLLGPQLFRQDFRQDLPMADIFKTYPMQGWQIALGELFAPAVILTSVQWLLVTFAAFTFEGFGGEQTWGLGLRVGVALGLVMIAPGLNFVTLIIPNAAVLMFPGWFQSGKEGPQGIEATGQRLVFGLGQVVVLIFSLVPASVMFSIIYFLLHFILHANFAMATPFAAAGAGVVLAAEAALGLLWLGRLFDKFDVAGDGANQ